MRLFTRSSARWALIAVLLAVPGYWLWHFEAYGVFPRPFPSPARPDDSARQAAIDRPMTYFSLSGKFPDEEAPFGNRYPNLSETVAALSRASGVDIRLRSPTNSVEHLGVWARDVPLRRLLDMVAEQTQHSVFVFPDHVEIGMPEDIVRVHPLADELLSTTAFSATELAHVLAKDLEPNDEISLLPGGLLVKASPKRQEMVARFLTAFAKCCADGRAPVDVDSVHDDPASWERLERGGNVQFVDAAFADVMRYIAVHHAPICCASGVPGHQSFSTGPVSCGEFLRKQFGEVEVIDGTIVIGRGRKRTRLYPVSDLLSERDGRTVEALGEFVSRFPLGFEVRTLCGVIVADEWSYSHRKLEDFLTELRATLRGDGVDSRSSRRQQMEAALASPLSVEFVNAPLSEVVQWLSDELRVPVRLGDEVNSSALISLRASSPHAGELLRWLATTVNSRIEVSSDGGILIGPEKPDSVHFLRVPRHLLHREGLSFLTESGEPLFGNYLLIQGMENFENARARLQGLKRLESRIRQSGGRGSWHAELIESPQTTEVRNALARSANFDFPSLSLVGFVQRFMDEFHLPIAIDVETFDALFRFPAFARHQSLDRHCENCCSRTTWDTSFVTG